MVNYTERMLATWTDDESLDIHDAMMRLTLDIVAKTLFDSDVSHDAKDVGTALHVLMGKFFRQAGFALLLPSFVPIPTTPRLQRAVRQLDKVIYGIIRQRHASGKTSGDLLSVFLEARDDAGTGMTDRQLHDEIMTLFLAGHETTANALSWTWYLLSQHPEIEARFHREVDALGDRLPQPDDLPRLPYTRMILAESMRLYPPAWAVGRRALNDFDAGGYTIPARSMVLMSQFIMHRDPRFHPEPERFDPERWRPEIAALRPKFSYFPFGGGTRVCIGEQFAWMEGILILATIAQRWRLRYVGPAPPALEPRITLRPEGTLDMKVERR